MEDGPWIEKMEPACEEEKMFVKEELVREREREEVVLRIAEWEDEVDVMFKKGHKWRVREEREEEEVEVVRDKESEMEVEEERVVVGRGEEEEKEERSSKREVEVVNEWIDTEVKRTFEFIIEIRTLVRVEDGTISERGVNDEF